MGYQRNTLQPSGDADSSMATTEWVDTYFLKLAGGTMDSGAVIRVDNDPSGPNELTRMSWVDGEVTNNRRFSFFIG